MANIFFFQPPLKPVLNNGGEIEQPINIITIQIMPKRLYTTEAHESNRKSQFQTLAGCHKKMLGENPKHQCQSSNFTSFQHIVNPVLFIPPLTSPIVQKCLNQIQDTILFNLQIPKKLRKKEKRNSFFFLHKHIIFAPKIVANKPIISSNVQCSNLLLPNPMNIVT